MVPSHWREGGPITLASDSPVLAGADQVADVDIDDTIKATYGYAKQDAGYGYSGVTGLNALIATVSTPIAAPVIVATRLSKGAANSARGAARLIGDALTTARAAGAGASRAGVSDRLCQAPRSVGRFRLTLDKARLPISWTAAGSRFPSVAPGGPLRSRRSDRRPGCPGAQDRAPGPR